MPHNLRRPVKATQPTSASNPVLAQPVHPRKPQTIETSNLLPVTADVTPKKSVEDTKLPKQGEDLAKSGKQEEAIFRLEEVLTILERSLKLDPANRKTLKRHAITVQKLTTLLKKRKEFQQCLDLFEKALTYHKNDIITLNSYANALAEQRQYEKANELFEQCLKLDGDDVKTLNSYANALMEQLQYKRASELFEKCLKLNSNDVKTLNSYANALVQQGKYEYANELFEQCLKLDCNHKPTLNSYANALVQQGKYEYANELFEQCLKLDHNHKPTLNSYANALTEQHQYERANQLFEQCLKLDGNDVKTLNSYANSLTEQRQYERANQLFEKCLKLDRNNVRVLNSYANALVQQSNYEYANELFEQCLKLDGNNIPTLNSYANALAEQRQYKRANELFKKFLTIQSNDYTRFRFSRSLENVGNYPQALDVLEKIDLDSLPPYHANVIRLSLGRLCYRLQEPGHGDTYFQAAINHSEDRDRSHLHVMQSLLAVDPDSPEAIDHFRAITTNSPHYQKAMKELGLHSNQQTVYGLFSGQEASIKDNENLYRAIYHKIANEVAVLKSISQRILRRLPDQNSLILEILDSLETLHQSIRDQRATEKANLAQIQHGNYREILDLIATTAHNISDEVNNQLAVIESKTRRLQRRLGPDDRQAPVLAQLLRQLELTQTALNDLKAIEEGTVIRRQHFPVGRLFEKWQPLPGDRETIIEGAKLRLDIHNADAIFDGDEEKIKSAINELVENSLKHGKLKTTQNNGVRDFLAIRIVSSNLRNPSDIAAPSIPGDRNYLYIEFTDNGPGIPDDHKEWIFQPLNTTAPGNEGSGLGLFIIRKTLEKMGGKICETGKFGRGAKFQIYLPYPDKMT